VVVVVVVAEVGVAGIVGCTGATVAGVTTTVTSFWRTASRTASASSTVGCAVGGTVDVSTASSAAARRFTDSSVIAAAGCVVVVRGVSVGDAVSAPRTKLPTQALTTRGARSAALPALQVVSMGRYGFPWVMTKWDHFVESVSSLKAAWVM